VFPKHRRRLDEALQDIGFDVPELSPELFLRTDRVSRMGVAPNRIEIQTGSTG